MGSNDKILHPVLRSIIFGIELFLSITIGITIVFPVLSFLILVNELIRLIVRVGLWLFYGEKYQLCCDTRATNYAALPKDEHQRTCLYAAEVEGPLDIEAIKSHYQKHVVENKIFASLQNIWESKWGFMCLKKCEDFNIKNHVRIYPGSEGRVVTEKELLQEILPVLRLDEPGKNKPQWEEVIIHQYKPLHGDGNIKSLRILRMHHSYMDGTSTLIHFVANTWSGEADFPYVINPTKNLNVSKFFLFFYKLTCFALFSSFMIRRISNPPIFRRNRFSANTAAGKALFAWTKPIPINDFKKIKEKSGVSMSAVLAAVLGGAVYNYEKTFPDQTNDGKTSTERHPLWLVAGMFPFPKDKLCNDHTVIETYLDTSDISGCERLTEMNDELSRMAKNPSVTINYWFSYIFGAAPSIVINFFLSLVRCPVVLSNVPLCTRRIKFGGSDCSDLNGFVPLMARAGLCITTVRYGEHMRYCLQAHPSIITEKQLSYLVQQIEEQVVELGLETSTLERKISTDVTLFEREKKLEAEDNSKNEDDQFNMLNNNNNNNNSNGRVSINSYSLLFKLKDSLEQIREGIKKIKEE